MLMNYSRVRAFNPDYRRLLWRERYYNRVGLFCFLFPGYPNYELQFNRRACDEALDPDPALIEIRDPRLKTAILPVYSIGLAGAPGKPFASFLKEASTRYEWSILAETENSELVRTLVPSLAGVARLQAGEVTDTTVAIPFEQDTGGPQIVILGGRRLSDRAPRATIDGVDLRPERRSANWAVFSCDLSAGGHRLELPSLDSGPDPESDYLYFASIIQRGRASAYVFLPGELEGR
jgi:hypothetical protein